MHLWAKINLRNWADLNISIVDIIKYEENEHEVNAFVCAFSTVHQL